MTTLVPLGRSDLRVSRLCFGGCGFGWTIDAPPSFAVLDAFVAGGGKGRALGASNSTAARLRAALDG